MSILLLGASGKLGTAVRSQLPDRHLLTPSRAELDLTHAASIADYTHQHRPSIILNASAYTAVDQAESEPELAEALNHTAVDALAQAAKRLNVPLVHVSTDYVFSGNEAGPYTENARTGPLGVYGATKLRGEQAITRVLSDTSTPWWIIRTSWLFGTTGRDFVSAMAERLLNGQALRVVDDQHGRPTYIPDLAHACLRLSGLTQGPAAPSGIYHFANAEETTWFRLTQAIAQALGIAPNVTPCATCDYPTAAQRPANSVLDTTRYERATGEQPRPWRAVLQEALRARGLLPA